MLIASVQRAYLVPDMLAPVEQATAQSSTERTEIAGMTKALPYTAAAVARAIRGVEAAGRHVVGIRVTDGTLIIGEKPVNVDSLALTPEHDAEAAIWADKAG